jgi:hypothetical protein
VYWRLVRSVRRNGKVVQETVAQLGELDAEGRAKAKALARQITGRGDQRELFEAPDADDAAVPVRLKRLRLERGRAFGDIWLGWTLWRALQLDALCDEVLESGREAVPWAQMAAILVIARLCEPSSELHIAEDWYRRTAVDRRFKVRNRVMSEYERYVNPLRGARGRALGERERRPDLRTTTGGVGVRFAPGSAEAFPVGRMGDLTHVRAISPIFPGRSARSQGGGVAAAFRQRWGFGSGESAESPRNASNRGYTPRSSGDLRVANAVFFAPGERQALISPVSVIGTLNARRPGAGLCLSGGTPRRRSTMRSRKAPIPMGVRLPKMGRASAQSSPAALDAGPDRAVLPSAQLLSRVATDGIDPWGPTA